MDNKKFEQLIDLIINENEEQARELFHEIVVEKSREIYESIMDEEMDMDEGGMGGKVGQMLDEINVEEEGMTEEEDMDDLAGDEETEVVDLDADDESEEEEHEEIEDAVVRIEDKLDQLMAEFEELMGDDGEEEEEEEVVDFGDEEGEEEEGEEEGSEDMMEAVQLQKVAVTHGDNGSNAKSVVDANAGQAGMASKPVKFSGDAEANPTSPKGPSNAYSKGETQVKGAGSFKNAPAQKSQDLEKAPKPVTKDAATGVKSPVAESKKTVKKIVK